MHLKKVSIIFICVFLGTFFKCSQEKSHRKVDVIDYKIEVKYQHPRVFNISVIMTSQIADTVNEMRFMLNPEVAIKSLQVKKNNEWQKQPYSFNGPWLKIPV